MIKKTTILIITGICFVSFVIISYQSKSFFYFPKIHLYSFVSPLINIKNFFSEAFSLREENKRLKEQLYQLTLQQKSLEGLLEENKKLKNLLHLQERKKEIVTIGRVVRYGSGRFLKTFWIDKGSNHGVRTNMPVITLNGLAGKVIFTSSNFSEVLILTDPNFSVAVRVERTRAEGILTGSGTNCVLKYIPQVEDIVIGDRLITSGLDGIFPEGINVGVIKRVDKKRGLFKDIEVIPYQTDSKIEEVAIIKN
uniref:Cell shape-determining protein MreC n=1 Tax=Thermodesulfovibrio aggregans TaxID=86166 RepID=A0A7C4EKH2_9BACT